MSAWMKSGLSLVVVCGALVLSGCGTAKEGTASAQGLKLKDGESFANQPPCGVDQPQCPSNLTCAALELAGGTEARCVDVAAVCSQLQCGSGECVVLESYPVQVRCR